MTGERFSSFTFFSHSFFSQFCRHWDFCFCLSALLWMSSTLLFCPLTFLPSIPHSCKCIQTRLPEQSEVTNKISHTEIYYVNNSVSEYNAQLGNRQSERYRRFENKSEKIILLAHVFFSFFDWRSGKDTFANSADLHQSKSFNWIFVNEVWPLRCSRSRQTTNILYIVSNLSIVFFSLSLLPAYSVPLQQ